MFAVDDMFYHWQITLFLNFFVKQKLGYTKEFLVLNKKKCPVRLVLC